MLKIKWAALLPSGYAMPLIVFCSLALRTRAVGGADSAFGAFDDDFMSASFTARRKYGATC
ncbi:hypothetical protein [Rhodoblastus sp.]|uniref:hypothetical protein n=1 Tax=Rhodoblastus sp. TaxID=1962975 RepID=UPI003F9CB799